MMVIIIFMYNNFYESYTYRDFYNLTCPFLFPSPLSCTIALYSVLQSNMEYKKAKSISFLIGYLLSSVMCLSVSIFYHSIHTHLYRGEVSSEQLGAQKKVTEPSSAHNLHILQVSELLLLLFY